MAAVTGETSFYQTVAFHTALLDAVDQAVVAMDPTGCVVYWNQTAEQLYGWNRTEVMGRQLSKVLVAPELVERGREISALLRSGSSWSGEFPVVRRDGSTIPVFSTNTPVFDAAGELMAVIGVSSDVTEQIRARVANAQLSAIVQSSDDAIIGTTLEGKIGSWNRGAETLYGISAGEVLGGSASVLDAGGPAGVHDVTTLVRRVGDGEQVERTNQRRQRADGSWCHVSVTVSPVLGADGGIVGASVIAREVTDLVRLTEATERDRRRLAEAQRVARLGSYEWDLVSEDLVWSEEHYRILGIDRTMEPGYELFMTRVVAEDRPKVRAAIEHTLDAGAELDLTYRYVRPDGSCRWLHSRGSVMIDSESQHRKLVGTMHDVTDQRHAQRVQAELSAIVQSSAEAIIGTDLDGTITSWNAAAARLLGYTEEQILARPISMIITSSGGPDPVIESIRAGLAPPRVDAELQRRDGSVLEVSLRASPVFDPEERLIGASVIAHDVSEQRRLARAAEDARKQLDASRQAAQSLELDREAAERSNAAKSAFLSRMSHELRTPLNAVLGFGQLLQTRDLPTDNREMVDQIVRGGRHLLDLIDEVLDVAHIESGQLDLRLEPLVVGEAVREAVALVTQLADRGNQSIAVSVPREPQPIVLADRRRLQQVLLNLLGNAIKYSGPGRHIQVAVTSPSSGVIRVAVIDDGPGISPEDLDRAFQPFERLGAERTAIEGSGVGLALVQTLIERMAGRAGAISELGTGSTFWFELPEANPPAMPSPTPDEPSVAITRVLGLDVLYIEDNQANIDLVRGVLGIRSGISLRTATTGHAGLAEATSRVPDLVLLDVHLPDMDGVSVLRHLRSEPSTGAVPVVVVSADATTETVELFRRMGISAYLTKPLNIAKLLHIVDGFA